MGVSTQIRRVAGRSARCTLRGLGHVDPGHVDAHRRDQPIEDAKGAAVDVVARDHVIARAQQLQERHRGRAARAEGESEAAALERGDAALEHLARGVARARVLEAAVLAGAVLREGRRELDRRIHRAGVRVGRLRRVDRERVDRGRCFGWSGRRGEELRGLRTLRSYSKPAAAAIARTASSTGACGGGVAREQPGRVGEAGRAIVEVAPEQIAEAAARRRAGSPPARTHPTCSSDRRSARRGRPRARRSARP